MRLKRLEVHGYKTFASKTIFEFPAGITAIVGPNGSGKSNVADSVRWVLGEQAFSLMRGKRTDDMIFAGTELRPRMGMVQVSLTLDNADGLLPIDYSEVTISRRAFRSGENEYLLNGSRVRLRDINELLARVGLAERTYAVLGQGLIDRALSLKPEERRAIIEEAAGISLYQSKRDDALRRLEQTQRNLERVQDILAELGPRLRSLERQARRAQQAQLLQGELDGLLRVWYGYQWRHVKAALRAARRAHRLHFGEVDSRRAALGALDDRLTGVRAEAAGLRVRLGELHRASSELHQRAESAQRELAVRGERIRALRAQREELLAELAGLQAERELQAGRVAQARAEHEQLERDHTARTDDVVQARATLTDRESEKRRLEQLAEQAQGEAQRLAAEHAAQLARAAELAARAAALQAEAERGREELRAREAELDAARQAVADAEQALAALDARAGELAAARQSGEEQLALVEDALRARSAELAQAEAEEGRLHDRRVLLERTRAELAGSAEGTRRVLQAARAGELAGVRGTLAEVLRVPAQLERAVETALGTDLDTVIVDSWAAAEAALAQAGGGLSLFALDSLRPARPLVAPSVPAVIGNLAQIVLQAGADPDYTRLIYAVLGRALLVRSRAEALALLPYLPSDSLLLTLAGERLSSTGAFVAPGAAQAGAGAGPGRLGREREWRELPARLEAAAAERREAAAALAEHERLREEWRQTLADLAASQQTLAAEQRTAEGERAERERAADRLAQAGELESARLAGLLEEVAGLRARAGLLEVEAEGLGRGGREAGERVREAREQLAALSAGADALATRVAQAERAAAVLAEARRRHDELLRGQEQLLGELELRAAGRERRAAALAAEAEALSASCDGLRGEAGALGAEIDALHAELHPAEARLAALEQRQAEVEAAEAGARSELHAAEAQASQAALELQLRQDELETLRRHIDEDLGLVALALDDDISGQEPLPLDPLVTRLEEIEELPPDLEQTLHEKRAELRRMGAINPDAPAEFAEVSERHGFLSTQVGDLNRAMGDLQQVIAELDELTRRDFKRTFDAVNAEFKEMFARLFGGGAARLELTDPEDLVTTGIDVVARPPGKRLQPLALLSGGERALTAAALIFALLRVSPPPFCILDEVDAALDESNVVRFRDMLLEFQQHTQFIVITHNRGTMQGADTFYGITMSPDGSSAAYSVRLVGDELVQARPAPAPALRGA